jgi:hypothetical protein
MNVTAGQEISVSWQTQHDGLFLFVFKTGTTDDKVQGSTPRQADRDQNFVGKPSNGSLSSPQRRRVPCPARVRLARCL